MGSFYDNDEAPSIFDIAMAYENGNGGIIRPKVKKISDTYKDLSDDEKKFIYKHPRYAYKFNANAEKAKAIGKQFGGGRNGYGDAVRHCYWCALIKYRQGLILHLPKSSVMLMRINQIMNLTKKIWIYTIIPSDIIWVIKR